MALVEGDGSAIADTHLEAQRRAATAAGGALGVRQQAMTDAGAARAAVDGYGVEAREQGVVAEQDEVIPDKATGGSCNAKAGSITADEAPEAAAGHPVGCERPRFQRLQTGKVLVFRVPYYHTPDTSHEAATR